MSHETHETHETHQDAHGQQEKRSVISLRSSFWFVIILVFLFIAAINFVDAYKNEQEAPKHEKLSTSPAIITPPTNRPAKDTALNK